MKHLLLLHKVKFYKRLYLRSDLVHNFFGVSLISRPNGIYDECMTTVLVHCTLPWIMYIHSFMNMLMVVCSLCLCVLVLSVHICRILRLICQYFLANKPCPKWSPVLCRSSAGQKKFAGQRPTFYHCATQPTGLVEVPRTERLTLPSTSV